MHSSLTCQDIHMYFSNNVHTHTHTHTGRYTRTHYLKTGRSYFDTEKNNSFMWPSQLHQIIRLINTDGTQVSLSTEVVRQFTQNGRPGWSTTMAYNFYWQTNWSLKLQNHISFIDCLPCLKVHLLHLKKKENNRDYILPFTNNGFSRSSVQLTEVNFSRSHFSVVFLIPWTNKQMDLISDLKRSHQHNNKHPNCLQ